MREKNTADKPGDWKNLQLATQRAKTRSEVARWNTDIAVFMFSVFIVMVILLFVGVKIEIIGGVALFGLSFVWFEGRRRGSNLYKLFLSEELSKLNGPSQNIDSEKVEEEIEKALRRKFGL